jgi:KipI family sensor histidine kinase inhibitor
MEPKLHMLGDRALLFTFSDSVSNEVNDLVLHLSSALENLRVPGIIESQPAYSAICIHFDPHVVGPGYLKSLVKRLIRQYQDETGVDCKPPRELASHSLPRRLVELPVVYGGEHGPDLPWAAQHLGMDPEEIVKRHTARTYRVYMIGFTPGFPYMGGMDESLTLPRLPDPRKVVPAGSVGIAGSQTGIYSMDAPGGWRLIGKTPVNLFDAGKTNPSLLRAGDEVRFVPISQDQAGGAHAKITYGKANPEVSSDTLSTMADTPLPHDQPESLGVPAILVENPGFFTIVVDRGRHGYRKMGVPVSGAADLHSYHQANLAVGNKNDEAALEMTLLGGRFRSMADITVAVAGAHATVTIDGSDAHVCQPVAVPKGSVLEVGPISRGCRAYLAVAGGLDIRMVLGSASTYLRGGFGGYCGRPLKPGDVLSVGPAPDYDDIRSNWSGAERPTTLMEQIDSIDEVFLRIVPGPEATEESLRVLCSSTYTVRPESDRMGLRLDGPKPMDGPGDILSSVVVPGTIQVPSDGRPILLLADAQTTGGYRRLGTVVSRDLSLAGQLWPGARVRFRTV